MFNFIKYIILFSLLPPCASCAMSPTKEIIAKSTMKLDGNNTNIRDLIEIDGYYIDTEMRDFVKGRFGREDISAHGGHLMFFEDGTYARGFYFKEGLTIENVKENMSESIRRDFRGYRRAQWSSAMGVYRIEGDMIIGHLYSPPNNSFFSLGAGWLLYEERYKIVNRTTINRIYYSGLLKTFESDRPWRDAPPYIFVSAKNLPSSGNWLKEERWIWRNESDWKAYMEKIKRQ